jgi:hypothetical protein
MRKILAFALIGIMTAGCGPTKQPVQNEFLLNLKRTSDFQMAMIDQETEVADGVFFNLKDAKILTSIPNVDPDSPFDKIFDQSGGFLVCKAEVWKTKKEAVFPKFDLISVVPTFASLTTDQFIISHAQLAYGVPVFDVNKVNENKQTFLFVSQIRTDDLGWSFQFYKEEHGEVKVHRIVDSGQ